MKFAIVILNYLNYKDVLELLASLNEQKWSSEVKVYIVDNASPNDSVLQIERAIVDIKMDIELIVMKENNGFAKGENAAIFKARKEGYDYIMSINSDVVFTPLQDNFLNVIRTQYEKDQKIAIITPNIIRTDGHYQNPMQVTPPGFFKILILKTFFISRLNWVYYFIRLYILFGFLSKMGQWRDSKNVEQGEKEGLKNSGYIYAAHGSLQVFTPSYFEYFKGHGEEVFMYCEEYIKAEYLWQKNLKVWFENSIHVTHKTSKSVEMMTHDNKEKIKFILYNITTVRLTKPPD